MCGERSNEKEYPIELERAKFKETPKYYERKEYSMPTITPSSPSMPLLTGRLNKAMLQDATRLTPAQIRGLVDTYYQVQEYRKAAANQERAVEQGVDDNPLVAYVVARLTALEHDIQRMMDVATDAYVPSRWAKSFIGIGPCLSAGLLAHIDITKAPTPSAVWRYAGLDPTLTWEKGQKRPWNARLKVLAWKCGQSFMKFSNHPEASIYATLYRQRKAQEQERNTAGAYAETAAQLLEKKRFREGTTAQAAYSKGLLPDGQIDARARRYAVKIFLQHYWHVAYEAHYHRPAPQAYILAHDPHHTKAIPVPHWYRPTVVD